ncbi:MAG: Holliday junction resolvase-like protein [Anaerolineae bacterium]|jgi:predicted Holliday junction resolvase-like endonuclease|nr:Holliday junction resolvase-like protein [Anaerolineae bacterium]
MDTLLISLLLIAGVLLGAALAYFLLRGQQKAAEQALRKELAETYEAKTQTAQSRTVQTYESRLHLLQEAHLAELQRARKESTDQSRAVLKGKMAEQIAPLLPGFNYWPADARFLGDPIDYVVFNGYSNIKDNGEDALEVVILDIKKGQAPLSQGQRQIARAIEAGHVRFEVVRIYEDGEVKCHSWQMPAKS